MTIAVEPTLGWEVIALGRGGPGPRSRHALVYDRHAQAAVLFGGIVWQPGGKVKADTRELRGPHWFRVYAWRRPAARQRSAM